MDFKVGDRVIAKEGAYCNHPKGSDYNLPREVGEVVWTEIDAIKVKYGDFVSPPVASVSFHLVLSIEVGKTYVDNMGRKYEVIRSSKSCEGYFITERESTGNTPWGEGRLYYHNSCGKEKVDTLCNLVKEYVVPKRRVLWYNFYEVNEDLPSIYTYGQFISREEADEAAHSGALKRKRLGRIKVVLEEGQWDE